MNMKVSATDALRERDISESERLLHHRMQWFFEKHAPDDKYAAAEFQADLLMVVQAVHQDASRHTHELLSKSLAAMPNPWPLIRLPDGQATVTGKT